MKTLHDLSIDKTWTLFLDRDGVINTHIENDYVKSWDEFEFIDGVFEALERLSAVFGTIVVVTNQQGIGKGLYTDEELNAIHQKMLSHVHANKGRIDKVYYCGSLTSQNDPCRKPGNGMALKAKIDFPSIDFSKAIIAGDTITDMQFGHSLGMKKVYIHRKPKDEIVSFADFHFATLLEMAKAI